MTDKTNRTLTDDEIAVLTEYRDEAGYKDSRVKWQTISEHLHARGYLELNPIQKPGHRQYVLTPAGRRALHGDAPSDEAEPNTPPETEAEVDAYLRAHGYDPEALAAEARAKFGSPLTPAPSTDAVTFDALQNSEREAYGRFCITAPNTDEGKQAERDLYRTRSDLCDFIDSHAATIRAALTVEPMTGPAVGDTAVVVWGWREWDAQHSPLRTDIFEGAIVTVIAEAEQDEWWVEWIMADVPGATLKDSIPARFLRRIDSAGGAR